MLELPVMCDTVHMPSSDVVYIGTIDWQEFVAATIHMGKLENEDAVRSQLTAKHPALTVLP